MQFLPSPMLVGFHAVSIVGNNEAVIIKITIVSKLYRVKLNGVLRPRYWSKSGQRLQVKIQFCVRSVAKKGNRKPVYSRFCRCSISRENRKSYISDKFNASSVHGVSGCKCFVVIKHDSSRLLLDMNFRLPYFS